MGSYRPPQHGYGPPQPPQDPYARPGSTAYGHAPTPAPVHGYGSPVNQTAPWNPSQPQPFQHGQAPYQTSQTPLPPPPPTAPPAHTQTFTSGPYPGQPLSEYEARPTLPPRIPQPYGPASGTPTNTTQPAFQAPTYGTPQDQGHQRMSSVAPGYQQEVLHNQQNWPQHPPYSTQPPTHHYDPPLPPRPGSQGHSIGAPQQHTVGNTQQAPSGYGQPQPPYQQYETPGQPQGHNPAAGSYDPNHSQQQYPAQQSSSYYPGSAYGGAAAQTAPPPPPPPPKPVNYEQQRAPYGYPPTQAQPPRPSSVQQPYQGISSPPPPAGYQQSPLVQGYDTASQTGYPSNQSQPVPPSSNQPNFDHAQRPDRVQTPSHSFQSTTQQGPPRPGTSDEPVSPLQQSRPSISFSRPGSTTGAKASQGPPNKSAPSNFAFSSDWEHFGSGADEIDDTAMYGVKKDDKYEEAKFASVELPASSPVHGRSESGISAPSSFHPSPAVAPASNMQPTPSPMHTQGLQAPSQGHQYHQQAVAPPVPPVEDEADYIPPMPNTPPAVQRPARTSIIIGGSGVAPNTQPTAYSYSSTPASQPSLPVSQVASFSQSLPRQPSLAQPATNELPQSNAYHQPQPSGAAQYVQSGPQNHQATPGLEAAAAAAAAGLAAQQVAEARRHAEDAQSKLAHIESELSIAKSSVAEKDALLLQRDAAIVEKDGLMAEKVAVISQRDTQLAQKDAQLAQKDALMAEKDAEIAQRVKHLNEMQTTLREITDTFEALKASTSGLEERLKTSEAAQAELKAKLEQSEAGSITAREAHGKEKSELDVKLKDAQTSLTAAIAESGDLKKQLEEAKAKAEAKAAEPIDIAPGLDPWFKGSLERCKDMLFTESKPLPTQERLQVFMDFVNAEARLRGIDLPFGPKGEIKGFTAPQTTQQTTAPKQQEPSKAGALRLSAPKESDGFVMVDSAADVQYSPGGRPIFNAPPIEEFSPGGRPILRPSQSQPVLSTGAVDSSVGTQRGSIGGPQKAGYQPFRGDGPQGTSDSRETSPMRNPPAETAKPAYKPFTWKQGESGSSASTPAPSVSHPAPPAKDSATPVYKPLYKPGPGASPAPPASKGPSEPSKQQPNPDILVDHIPGMKIGGKKDVRSPQDETMLPMPLKPRTPAPPGVAELSSSSDVSQSAAKGIAPTDRLSSLLRSSTMSSPSARLRDLKSGYDAVSTDYSSFKTLLRSWEESAATTRSQLERERAKRQAELEKRNNELFDSGEIGYGDFETLEGQAKEEELRGKAEEDAVEYKSYSAEVFDAIFRRCQDDISALSRVQSDLEGMVKKATAGATVIAKAGDSSQQGEESLSQVLTLLLDVHGKLEAAHAEIARAVQERDRRYKLTQTKPLYAKGDIGGMKRVERAFEDAEKKAEVRTRVERAERCKRIWKMLDAEMERGTGENEDYVADITAAVADLKKSSNVDELVLDKAAVTIGLLYDDTLCLMRMFETVDMQLNECEYEVSVASAKLKGDSRDYFDRLAGEKEKEDVKLRADAEKRARAVQEHRREAEQQVRGGKAASASAGSVPGESSEEREARERKQRALEAARRRNGEI